MSQDIVPFSLVSVPDYIKNAGQSELTKSLLSGNTRIKRISIRGKRFRLVVGGEEIATRQDNFLDVIIVNVAKDYNRQYYAGVYDSKAEATAPTCWSADSRKPHHSVERPLHHNCQDCPMNVKGSGSGNTKACRIKRRLAVTLATDIDGGVYMLELAATSVFGTGDKDHMPFDQYANIVGSQGFSVDRVVTRVTFDDDADQPKLTFGAVGFPAEHTLGRLEALGASAEAKAAVTLTVYQADRTAKEAAPVADTPPPVARAAPNRESVKPKPELTAMLSKFSNLKDSVDDE
jgi:hypothetical protein